MNVGVKGLRGIGELTDYRGDITSKRILDVDNGKFLVHRCLHVNLLNNLDHALDIHRIVADQQRF